MNSQRSVLLARSWLAAVVLAIACFAVDLIVTSAHKSAPFLVYLAFAFFLAALFLWARYSRSARRPKTAIDSDGSFSNSSDTEEAVSSPGDPPGD